MKARLNVAFAWLLVDTIDLLCRPLLEFSEGRIYRVRDAHKGILMLGSPGEGKTTAMRTIMLALMRAGHGGIALVVKSDFTDDVLAVAKAAGRMADVVVLREDGEHRFNPFSVAKDATSAAAMMAEISDSLASEDDSRRGDDGDWRKQRDMLLENLCVVCLHLHGEITFARLREIYRTVPQTLSGVQALDFKTTPLGRMAHGDPESSPPFIRYAVEFLTRDFQMYPDKTQGSVRAMIMPVFHNFMRPSLAAIFGGDSTVTMDEVLNHRKILLADFPATESDGRCANAVLQYCFCKAAISPRRLTDAFLLCDEFQETAGRILIKSLSLFRQYRVSPVLVSQSIAAIEYRVGQAGCKTIVGLLHSVFFFAQNDPDTRKWAEEYIGNESYWKKSETKSEGKTSRTETEEYRPKVRRDKLSGLEVGHSYCCRKADYWKAKWRLKLSSSPNPIRVRG